MNSAPQDFPVPNDVEGFWTWDKMHGPRPITPLSQDIITRNTSIGFTKAMDEFACPVGIGFMAVNYYGYLGMVPQPLGGEAFEQRLGRYQEVMRTIVPRVGELWASEWLPSILPGLEEAKSTDYASLSDEQLLATLDAMCDEFVRRYVVHGKINFVTASASMFADAYNDLFKPEDTTEPYEALQGFPTRSVDAGRGLWRLSRAVKGSPALLRLFETTDSKDLPQALGSSEEGRAFLAELAIYLDEFGWRADAFELADRSWREDPAIPLNAIQGYIFLGDEGDPGIRYEAAIRRREDLVARARERLAGDPPGLEKFNGLYEAARHYLTVTEDHNFYIDQIGNTVMRLPVLEIGRRLASRGAIAEADDVVMLYKEELRPAMGGADERALVARRRAEMERFAKVVPVPALGTPPPPNADPFAEAMSKMFGMPPEPSRDPAVINGIAASPGAVRGRAKVVRNLSEASKLEPGDVLVCEMTMPPWTPLFSTASAVVADTVASSATAQSSRVSTGCPASWVRLSVRP